MTARDDLAVLFERRIIGEDPDGPTYWGAIYQAGSELDAIASLATNPETAPAVFGWLVEAGVLRERCAVDDLLWHPHYHSAVQR